jgi:hypothetical protein
MLKKIGRLGLVALLIAIPLSAVIWMTLFDSEVGMARDVGVQETGLETFDYSSVPQSVIDDAVALASELVGNSQGKLQTLVDQLLGIYLEAKNKDVVVFFNSGGWGWNRTEETPGWSSILDGIKTQLDKLGYQSLILNYHRTSTGIKGCIQEFFEAITHYPHKAWDLARQVEFLTDELPNLRIIVAGESTGTVISDKTMDILKDKTQVYSIQTGTPFWYKPIPMDRTLLMNSNGRCVDTFSYGNLPAMVWATVKGWLGMSSPDDNPGDILSWLKAPGHDYSWQYPGVYAAVVNFLDKNFSQKD